MAPRALAHAWITGAALRDRVAWRLGRRPDRLELVRRHAPGRSFADIGCMWNVDGAIAFAAEASGATAVTAADGMAPTPAFDAEHARRDSAVRFVRGDLHEHETLEAIGRHDVVWCSGVLYHVEHPLLTLERLASIAGSLLIVGTQTIPEVPGLPQACIFWPGLDAAGRAPYRRIWHTGALGVSEPFDRTRAEGNWFWGMSPSAVLAMFGAVGLEVLETHRYARDLYVVARPGG